MKRILSAILLLALFAALLSGCAGELPSAPPLPGNTGSAESAGNSAQPDVPDAPDAPDAPTETEEPLPEPTAEPVPLPDALELDYRLPAVESDEELRYYFSPAIELDCGFCYPSYCAAWLEKGAIRLSPYWFFGRMFFSSVALDDENAPRDLLEMLEPGKWGTVPTEGTAGTGWTALRALNLKYDTWRRWAAWETDDRYCLLYGVCFDGREGEIAMIFDTVSASYLKGEEMLLSAPEGGAALRRAGDLELDFTRADLRGEYPLFSVELELLVSNRGAAARTLRIDSLSLDGEAIDFEDSCVVESGENYVWALFLPLTAEEGAALCRTLSAEISAPGRDGELLFALPVNITLN